jgi:hypothetical protein
LLYAFADGKDRWEDGSSSFCSMFALGLYMEKNVARLWLVMSNSSFPYHKQEL